MQIRCLAALVILGEGLVILRAFGDRFARTNDVEQITNFTGLPVLAMVPRINARLSATVQSKPGAILAANYAVPNGAVAASLGRNLSANAPNVTVNLVAPGTVSGDRINQLDVRAAKILRRGPSRTMVAVDIYNALNSSAGLTYNTAFVPGGQWPQPNTILTPRFFRITAEVEF